ncbi:MAG: hypothetical protein EOP33_04010 [Rickettsiaceae bacterium]|nr:MAG: hypothetical protein EOP33_04010 [Rickettsiaceae bacterium]
MLTRQANTKEYELLRRKISQCFSQLNDQYSLLTNQLETTITTKIFFVSKIVTLLIQHIEIINHSSLLAKQSLIESLENNLKTYLVYDRTGITDDIKQLQTAIIILLDSCTDEKPLSVKLNSQELDLIDNQVTDLLEKCQMALDQKSDDETIYQIQASAIAYNIFSLSLKCQRQLQDKLLLIRELWYIENYKNKEHKFLLTLNQEPASALAKLKSSDIDIVFAHIILMLTQEDNLLHDLSDAKLIKLYDRLRHHEPQSEVRIILAKIHAEAKFRYEHSRLSDTEYELLKRFQNLDSIVHQIESTEFSLTESYLLRKETFLHELVLAIAKHLDNIRAVKAQDHSNIGAVISVVEQQLKKQNISEHIITATMSLINSNLKIKFDTQAFRRYAELDKFAAFCIITKYHTLFANIFALLNGQEDSRGFLQHSICRKFAQDFHSINPASSSLKLRTIISERNNIMQQLVKINFVDIFNIKYINNISSLNFTKQLKSNNSISADNYIQHIIAYLLLNASSSQLGILYNLIVDSKEPIHNIIKTELIKKISERTTLTKLIHSIVTGKKHEYDELKVIQLSLQHSDSTNTNH